MFDIQKVSALPAAGSRTGNTLYMVPTGDTGFQLHMTNADGSVTRSGSSEQEILALIDARTPPVFSDTPPATTSNVKFWFHTEELTLYVLYDDGDVTDWVEATASVTIPEFGGTGDSGLIAHSNHNHDGVYAKVVLAQW